MIFRKLGMGRGGFVVRRAIRSPRSLVYSFTCLLVYLFPRRLVDGSTSLLVYRFTCLLVSRVYSFTCPRVYSFTDLLVYLFLRRLVYGSTSLLVYRFTCLLVLASSRLRVHLFTRLPVYLSTRFPRRRHHNCPRTAGRIWASSSTTRARSKPSRITARMVSSPAIVPHRLSGSCASISVVMLVA